MYQHNFRAGCKSFVLALLAVPLLASAVAAQQTTAFTYQGRLTDGGAPANNNYDLQFTLWDAVVGGTQQPQPTPTTLTRPNVAVTGGVFSVMLDFGVTAFPGADRFLEIGVRPAGNASAFTILSPRQQISSTPYALRTLNATAADSLSSACASCVQDSQINSVSGSKVTGTIPTSSVPSDSTSYIQNRTTAQTNSNFNISGNGVIGGDLTVTGRINANISGNFIQNATTQQNNANFNISGNGIIAGNVGIGVASPQSKLHILGNAGVFTPFRGLTVNQIFNATSNLNGYAMAVTTTNNNVMATNFLIDSVGNIGIGTASPAYRLEVQTALGSYGFIHSTPRNLILGLRPIQLGSFAGSGASGASGGWLGTLSNDPLHFFVNNGGPSMTISTNGNVGIGTFNPTSKLEIAARDGLKLIGNQPFLTLTDSSGGNRTTVIQNQNGDLALFTNTQRTMLLKDNGHVSLSVLEILGGNDLAENFEVNSAVVASNTRQEIKPGLLVSIDPLHSGKLVVSSRAYDRRVAGIISGAGGINAAMLMGHTEASDGKRPIALSGRVYCWADATNGPIRPGDLLTTSWWPGHAMKIANHAKARGAIIGKAMTSLRRDRGLVLVLVSLQ